MPRPEFSPGPPTEVVGGDDIRGVYDGLATAPGDADTPPPVAALDLPTFPLCPADRYRFTRWVERDHPEQFVAAELYDHRADPQENQNIANEPTNAALIAQLTEQWKKGWRAAGPSKP